MCSWQVWMHQLKLSCLVCSICHLSGLGCAPLFPLPPPPFVSPHCSVSHPPIPLPARQTPFDPLPEITTTAVPSPLPSPTSLPPSLQPFPAMSQVKKPGDPQGLDTEAHQPQRLHIVLLGRFFKGRQSKVCLFAGGRKEGRAAGDLWYCDALQGWVPSADMAAHLLAVCCVLCVC